MNKQLVEHKQRSRENLMSEKGRGLRGRRCTEVEQTFGQIKWNKKFNRLLLRSVPRVSVEIGIVAIAHNLQKLAAMLALNEISGLPNKFLRQLTQLLGELCHYLNIFFIPVGCRKKSMLAIKFWLQNSETKKAA